MYWVRHFRPAFLSLQITFVTPVKLSKLQLPLAPKMYDGQYGVAHVGPAHHLRTGTGRKTRRTTRPYKHKNIKIRVSRTGPSKVAHAWAGSAIRNEVTTVTLAIATGNKIKTTWKRQFKNEQNRKNQSQQICALYLQTATAMSRISEHRNIRMSTAQAQIAQEMSSKKQKYLPTVFTSVSVQLPPLFSHTSHFNLQRDPNSTHKHNCGAWCALRANWRNASSEQYLRCMRNSWLLEPNLFFLERHNTAVWKHTLDPTAMTPTSARLMDTFACHQLPWKNACVIEFWMSCVLCCVLHVLCRLLRFATFPSVISTAEDA